MQPNNRMAFANGVFFGSRTACEVPLTAAIEMAGSVSQSSRAQRKTVHCVEKMFRHTEGNAVPKDVRESMMSRDPTCIAPYHFKRGPDSFDQMLSNLAGLFPITYRHLIKNGRPVVETAIFCE